MSETRKTDVLKLMEDFDLKQPFIVDIFYESDDDKQIENNKSNQAKELDDILNGIIGDISKASQKSNQIDHALSKHRRLSDESSPAKRAKANNKIDGYGIRVVEQLNVENRAENIQNDQVVTRKEAQQSSINNQALYATPSSNAKNGSQANDQCAAYKQHNIQSQQIMTNTTWQDTINNTRLCSVNNGYTANTRQTSESNNNEQILISSLYSQNSANNSIHPLTSLSQMIVSQNQTDLHLKASECVGTLLTTVSSHLVLVMKAWTEYMQVYYKSPNKTSYAIDVAYKQYRATKYHFFYLSLASVNNIVLPNENDHVFIKKFIEYTLGFARSRNIHVTYQDMRTVLNELLDWVKCHRYPLLNELLRPPAQPHAQSHIDNRSKEHQVRQCDSTNNAGNVRSELPGRDSAIHVNSSAIGTTQLIQSINTPTVQSLTYYETLMQHRRPEPQGLANHSSHVEEFQAFTRQDDHRGANEDPKNKKKRGPRQKQNHPVVSVLPVQARTLPTYEDSISTQRNYADNHLISSANYDLSQPQNQACEVNRSLSRDSGIMSPRSPAQPDLNYSSLVMTPFITHVTSLNPSATQIKDGVCLVCGMSTKQMCLGCYKVYYCSNECQANFSLDDTRQVLQMKNFIESHGKEIVSRFEQYIKQ